MTGRRQPLPLAALVTTLALAASAPHAQGPRLSPTAHPPLPASPSQYWILPESTVARANPPAGYAQYHAARALTAPERLAEAEALLTQAIAATPQGHLRYVASLQLAEVAIKRGDAKRAADLLEDLTDDKVAAPEEVWLRLGAAAEAAGDLPEALRAYRQVYYEFPLSVQAATAQDAIERLQTPALVPPDRYARELARAERLFTARRWAQSYAAFEWLARAATAAADRELIALRLAEGDYYLDRHRAARDGLRPYLEGTSREAEARFFFLTATRALGDKPTYVTLARSLVEDFPESSWSEEALNNLASHYIIENDDATADQVFRELTRRFPRSRYAERAAWRIGWAAYKGGNYLEAAQTFEAAASAFPRADTRPAWIYWSGRARDQLDDRPTANTRYRLAATDYLNSYYGRLAAKLLADRREPPVADSVAAQAAPMPEPRIPTEALVRQLVAARLYDDALGELQHAQRTWGDSPAIQATIAWLRRQQGLDQQAMERFLNIRGAITLMKRAYPQYLAAGGEDLPPDILRVMFPLDYWPLIRKYAEAHRLDPYLMASLIAQESTFTADIRSSANAYGLMQLIPAAGRQYARKVGLRYSLSLLSQPEANVRMGMAYFKDLSTRFGGDHFALASYNAGPHRVARWISERPGVAKDEFIDDIPFPETQNYVKRILGQADDYRRLYGPAAPSPRR